MAKRTVCNLLGAAAIVAAAVAVGLAPPAGASSHNEAPLIGMDPRADNTDLYAFVSPDQPDTVTIISNFIPLQAPASGPNFYSFDNDAVYTIAIDTTGNSRPDTVYNFQFNQRTRNPDTFLYNTGPINSNDDPDWNRQQTYKLKRVRDGVKTSLGSGLQTPPANIGPRSTPNYESLADAAVHDLGGGLKVFAGQREDPFFVDLGSIFDLAGLRPFNSLHAIPLADEAGRDSVANFNVHSIALQIPIDDLVRPDQDSIGVYSSVRRQSMRVLKRDGTQDMSGPLQQVSRIGNPLINEVVIPLGQKDFWNAQEPYDDGRFINRYLSPEVTRLENALYPALEDADETGRDDLVQILLTGIPGVNFTGPREADLLRLNTSVEPTAPVGGGNRLGALEGDFAGYPNGRRLEDDIVDIDLRAFAEGYGPILQEALGLPNRSPNNMLGDGVNDNDVALSTSFPYVATPFQGYEVP